MTKTVLKALHSVNSGILDVRSGYETLEARAEPEIMPTVKKLDSLHVEHADQIASLLESIGEGTDDGTIRGVVNKAANVVRDLTGSMDEDALSFVRQGEEQLLAVYDAALAQWDAADAPAAREVVQRQAPDIRGRIADLPRD